MLFTDDFNRADENLEANANWTRFDGTAGWGAVRSNRLACTTADSAGAAYFCPDTFSTRQYVQARLTNVTIDSGPFLCCRLQDRNNFVGIRYFGLSSPGLEMYRRNGGTLTSFGITGITCAANDLIRLEVDAGDWRILKNGVVVANGNSTVLATMLSPRCGVVMRAFISNPWVDDFEAGNLPVMGKFPASPTTGQGYAPGAGKPGWVWNGSVWVRAPAVISSPTAGYRNVVMNGDMMIWSRANLAAAAGTRLAPYDRWVAAANGSTMTAVGSNPALGSNPKEAFGLIGMAAVSVAGAANYVELLQFIEGVRTLAGKRATLSFWALADAVKPIALELIQVFGTGGSPSAAVSVPGGKVTLGTTLQKFTVNFDVPSIAGKTLGTAGDDYLRLGFWMDAGSTYNVNSSNLGQQSGTFYIGQVQLEEGGFSTPFERRPWHVELQMCMRYWEAGGMFAGFPCPSTGGYARNFTYPFKTTKRVAPTLSLNVTGASNVSTWNSLGTTVDWAGLQVIGSVLGNAAVGFNYTASAEYV